MLLIIFLLQLEGDLDGSSDGVTVKRCSSYAEEPKMFHAFTSRSLMLLILFLLRQEEGTLLFASQYYGINLHLDELCFI